MADNNKENDKNNKQPDKKQRFNWTTIIITTLIIVGIVLLILWQTGVFSQKFATMSISEFKESLTNRNLEKVSINNNNWTMIATFDGKDYRIATGYPISPTFEELGITLPAGVEVSASSLKGQGFPWYQLIFSLLPLILLIAFFWYTARRSGAMGGSPFGSNKAAFRASKTNIKMSDVAGQEEVKEEVQEVIDFLKRPKKYKAAGAKVPKGILLAGPPGTGKTLIAKAVATEAGVPFFSMSASQFIEIFAGQGARRVRELFSEARKNSPSIIFIDELDAIGRKRGNSFGNDEREQTLNQILTEMDGMNTEAEGEVLVMGATNRPEILDAALVRPGRFDRQIKVALPNVKERVAILELHAKGKRISDKVNFEDIARRTPRFSGAELAAIVNESALLSVRENSAVITVEHIDEAIDRVVAGPAKKTRVITPEENRMVAVHEAGHAVVGIKVKTADIVQKITIIPRGDAGGYNLITPKKEKFNFTKSDFEGMIMGALGGRAAEQIIYGKGEVTTGASDDIKKATSYARSMVTQYGMSKLGPIAYESVAGPQYLGAGEKQREYSDALAERIDEAIREIIMDAEKKAFAIIKRNLELLNLIVEELIDKETIVREEIEYLAKNLKPLPKRKPAPKKAEAKSLDDILIEIEKDKDKSKEDEEEE